MTSPAQAIALYLSQNGVGSIGGKTAWGIYIAGEPHVPDSVITVYDTPSGLGPDTDDLDRQVTLQVRGRGERYVEVYEKMSQVAALLMGASNLDLPSVASGPETIRFVMIVMTSDIAPIGRDDSDRHLLVMNLQARCVPL